MLQFSEFVWALSYSVWDVFNNFLLIDLTDRSKISSDQKRFFIALSLYPLSFFANTPFNTISFVIFFGFLFLLHFFNLNPIPPPSTQPCFYPLPLVLLLSTPPPSPITVLFTKLSTYNWVLQCLYIDAFLFSYTHLFIHSCILYDLVHFCINLFLFLNTHLFMHSFTIHYT